MLAMVVFVFSACTRLSLGIASRLRVHDARSFACNETLANPFCSVPAGSATAVSHDTNTPAAAAAAAERSTYVRRCAGSIHLSFTTA